MTGLRAVCCCSMFSRRVPSFAASHAVGAKVDDFTLQDYLGANHSLDEWRDKQAVVVVFLGTECPLAKLYGPRLAELGARVSRQRRAFVGIDSNQQDSLLEIGHYAASHKIDFPMLKDAAADVADQFGASARPKRSCSMPRGNVLYHGRIDDQFGVGYQRPTRRRHGSRPPRSTKSLAGKPVTTRRPNPSAASSAARSEKPRHGRDHLHEAHRRGSSTSIASAAIATGRSRPSRSPRTTTSPPGPRRCAK